MPQVAIEVCVDSVAGAVAAQRAGADRLELNCALELGGLTPSPGLVATVLEQVSIPVIAMARPRGGDFVYDDEEWRVIVRDIGVLLEIGVAGIACGALTPDGGVAEDRMDQLRQLVGERDLVFHKAFDQVDDWTRAGWQLSDLGVDRIMTSGGAACCAQGMEVLAEMQSTLGARMDLLPAGGIDAENVVALVEGTGVRQVHGRFSNSGALSAREMGAQVARIRSLVGG